MMSTETVMLPHEIEFTVHVSTVREIEPAIRERMESFGVRISEYDYSMAAEPSLVKGTGEVVGWKVTVEARRHLTEET